jgi:hypothetical protein
VRVAPRVGADRTSPAVDVDAVEGERGAVERAREEWIPMATAVSVSTSQRRELPSAGHLQLAPVVLRAAAPSCSAAEIEERGRSAGEEEAGERQGGRSEVRGRG